MEPVTHILTGACLSRAGFNRRAAYATLTMAVAAEFPDIDTLWSLRGPVAGFQHHRGITHTLVALPVEAALIVGAVYVLHRIRVRRAASARISDTKSKLTPLTAAPVRWGLLYGFALLALLSHLFLDYTNNYGLRPFFPFNPRWYAGSFVFIFDPLIFVLLVLAFLMPALFALINSEVGARRQIFRGRGWAIASLLCIAGWWSLRAAEHAGAEHLAAAQTMAVAGSGTTPQFMQPLRVLASPSLFNPFRWHIVSDFGDFYQLAEADMLTGSMAPAQDIHVKPERTPALLAAQASPLGRAYMDWSPMPFLSESRPGDPARLPSQDPTSTAATIVTFSDPRFMAGIPLLSSRPNPPLTGTVELDQQNRVIRQAMDGAVQPK
jgi:inner membrane protein